MGILAFLHPTFFFCGRCQYFFPLTTRLLYGQRPATIGGRLLWEISHKIAKCRAPMRIGGGIGGQGPLFSQLPSLTIRSHMPLKSWAFQFGDHSIRAEVWWRFSGWYRKRLFVDHKRVAARRGRF